MEDNRALPRLNPMLAALELVHDLIPDPVTDPARLEMEPNMLGVELWGDCSPSLFSGIVEDLGTL